MHTDSFNRDAHILIVDDEEANVALLQGILEQVGYSNVVGITDPRQALPCFLACPPDLVLLDLHMPHLDGFAVMAQLTARIPPRSFLPILILTADVTPETKERALELGAADFLTKPFEIPEVLLRGRNLLRTRFLQVEVQNHNALLESRVSERTRDLEAAHAEISRYAGELREAQLEILHRLALAAEYRDDDTGQHVQRVSQTSALLAQTLRLPTERIELLRKASTLHDVGKIGIPDQVLLKPGKLTSDEFALIKTHTVIGAKMLSGSRSPLLHMAEEIALTHHEKWDGGGYSGLQGETIPLVGRIVAVADVFDALTHERPYKHAWPLHEAVDEIKNQRERHFDPAIVDAFLELPHACLI